jgi:hypothetical protein
MTGEPLAITEHDCRTSSHAKIERVLYPQYVLYDLFFRTISRSPRSSESRVVLTDNFC